MKIEDPVLIVVDLQKGFLNSNSEHAVAKVVRLVKECSNCPMPVIFTRFLNTANSPFERFMGWTKMSTEPEISLADELVEFANTVLEKNAYSAITDEFRRLANRQGWKTLIICGIATESCVAKTAADAFEQNFRPIVVSDACASDSSDASHQAGLTVMRRFIGKDQIMTTDELLAELEK